MRIIGFVLLIVLLVICNSQRNNNLIIWSSGDLQGLNALLHGLEVPVNDTRFVKELPFLPLITLDANNISCGNFSVGEMEIDVAEATSQHVTVDFVTRGVTMDCSLDWRFEAVGVVGGGTAKIFTSGSKIRVMIGFHSEDFAISPPTEAFIEFCNITVNVEDVELWSELAIVNTVAGQFKPLIKQEIEKKISAEACNSVTDLAGPAMTDIVNSTSTDLTNQINEFETSFRGNHAQIEYRNISETLLAKSATLLNLTDTSPENPSVWFIVALERLFPFLGAEVNDGENGKDLAVNVVLRSLLSGGEVLLPFEQAQTFLDFKNEMVEAKISILSASISGFDSFTSISSLDFIAAYFIQNDFQVQNILFSLDFLVAFRPVINTTNMTPKQKAENQPPTYALNFTVSSGISNIDLRLSTLLALDAAKLSMINLACLSFTDQIMPCFLYPLENFSVLDLLFQTSPQLVEPKVTKATSPVIKSYLNPALSAMFTMYSDVVESFLPVISNTQIRSTLNPAIDYYISSYQEDNPPEVQESLQMSKYIDFRDLFLSPSQAKEYGASGTSPYGNLIHVLKQYLDQYLETSNQQISDVMNQYLVRPLTFAQSGQVGAVYFPPPHLANNSIIAVDNNFEAGTLQAHFIYEARQITLENLDTFSFPFKLVQPIRDSPYVLQNSVTIGGVEDKPLKGSLLVHSSFYTADTSVENTMELKISLQNLQLILDLFAKMNTLDVFGLTLDQIYSNPCDILSTIPQPFNTTPFMTIPYSDEYPTLSVPLIQLFTEVAALDLDCLDCDDEEYWLNVKSLMTSPEGVKDTTMVFNGMINFILVKLFEDNGLGVNLFQQTMDYILQHSDQICNPDSGTSFALNDAITYPSAATTNLSADTKFVDENPNQVMYIAIGIIVGLSCLTLIAKFFDYLLLQNHKKWLVEDASPQYITSLMKEQKKEMAIEDMLNRSTKSLMLSRNTVPIYLRYGMPFIFVGNMIMFLSGHLNLGAVVSVSVTFAGEEIVRIDNFYSFWLGRSIVDIWNAGARALAVLMTIFSVAWPYTKQIINLALWCSPPTWISVQRRGTLLRYVDILGKWSMVDIFVIVMSLVGFWISIQSPQNLAFLPSDLYALNLFVVPVWGLYANLTAQLISQISSHFFIHYHRRIIEDAMKTIKTQWGSADDTTKESVEPQEVSAMKDYTYTQKYKFEGKTVQVEESISLLLVIVSLIGIALMVVGNLLPSFSLNILGLVGLLVELGNEFQFEALTEHSVISAAQLLFAQAKYLNTGKDYVGLIVLLTVIVTTTLIVPIFLFMTLLYVWFTPMTRKNRNRTLVLVEILQAWQYAEVYIVSVLITIWQLGSISTFLINDSCLALEETFSTLVIMGILKTEDAQCLYVKSAIEPGLYYLLSASVFLVIVSNFIIKGVELREEDDRNAELEKIDFNRQFVTSASDFSLNDNSTPPQADDKQSAPNVRTNFLDFYRCCFRPVEMPLQETKTLMLGFIDDESNVVVSYAKNKNADEKASLKEKS